MANPHDALVKWTFAQPERAADELRSALPATITARLDWSSLLLEPGSFVDPELTERLTDLLFSVRTTDGSTAKIYVLLEAQRHADALMAYRLLRYMVRIWERWLEGHPGVRKLPAILPVVLYNGAGRWTAATDLRELFDLSPELLADTRELVPSFRFALDDLSAIPDDAIRARVMEGLPKLVLLSLKHGGRDLADRLGGWIELIRGVFAAPHGAEALARLVRYTIEVTDPGSTSLDQLRETLAPAIGPKAQEVVMTIAQQLIEQGRQEGLNAGVARQRAALGRQLRSRFGELPPAVLAQIEAADPDTLDRWSDRFVNATRLEDVFA